MKRMKIYGIVLIFCLITQISFTRHFNGGYFTYEVIGEGTISGTSDVVIRLILFRDCGGTGANFDNPAEIGFYSKQDSGYVFQFKMEALTINIEQITETNCQSSPQIPVCIEVGTYEFIVNDIPDSIDYAITYQRCCLSNTLLNIQNSDEQGLAIILELKKKVFQNVGKGPTIDPFNFPHAVCVNHSLNLPIPISSSLNNILNFNSVGPLKGGGNLGSMTNPGNARACDGLQPDPRNCPPIFENLVYESGFTVENPFGESGVFNLTEDDEFLIESDLIGSQMLAISAEELVNNQILSRTYVHWVVNFIMDNTTSIEKEVEEGDLRVFPNPNNGFFNIRTEVLIEDIKAYNSFGQLIPIEILNNSTFKILNKGLILLSIKSKSKIFYKKLMIE